MKIINQNDQYKENENDGITILNFINGYELGIYDSISTMEEIKMFFPDIYIGDDEKIEDYPLSFQKDLKKIFNFWKKLVDSNKKLENVKIHITDFIEYDSLGFTIYDFSNYDIGNISFDQNNNNWYVNGSGDLKWEHFEWKIDEIGKIDYNLPDWPWVVKEDDLLDVCSKFLSKELDFPKINENIHLKTFKE